MQRQTVIKLSLYNIREEQQLSKIKVFITSNVPAVLPVLTLQLLISGSKAFYSSSRVIKKSPAQDRAFDKGIRAANKQLKAFAQNSHLCSSSCPSGPTVP